MHFVVLISLAPLWARYLWWLLSFQEFLNSAVQEFFFPRKLKWKVSPNKLAHTLAIRFETCVSLWSGTGWLFVLCFFVPLHLICWFLYLPPDCVSQLLSLQPGSRGCCLALETGGYQSGAWRPGFEPWPYLWWDRKLWMSHFLPLPSAPDQELSEMCVGQVSRRLNK